MAQFKDYYKILEVDPEDSQSVIKKAHRDKVIIFHPDRFMNAPESARHLAEEELKKVNEAFSVLKDPIKRKEYDKQYYKSRDSDQDNKDATIKKPKPVVDKPYIIFDDVTPGEIKTDSFILRNSGGDYENIDVSTQTPNSWLKITGVSSLDPNQPDELPLKIGIEASVSEWGKDYVEYIIIRLDNEEIKVKVELNSKNKAQPPAFNKKKLIPIILIPIFFIIISCISIYYIFNWATKQNDNTVEKEESLVEESTSSSDNEFEKDINLKKFNFEGKIAYFESGERSVSILNSKNNDEVKIDLDMYWQKPVTPYLSWSPDGLKLVIGFGMDLYIINVLDGSAKKIYSLKTSRIDDEDTIENRGYFEAISWSPDGKNILLTVTPGESGGFRYRDISEIVSNKIILIDIEGKNEQIILENFELRYLGLDWSSDGSKIIYSTGKGRTYELYKEDMIIPWDGHVALWTIDVNNNFKTTQIADFTGWTNQADHRGKYIENCRWSPSGEKILFDVVQSGYFNDESMIYIIDSNGENAKEFLQGHSPNWSFDGNQIIYGGYDEDEEISIILKNIDSNESEIIDWGHNPVWHSHD